MSFINRLIGSMYYGACRNSFNDTLTTYCLTSAKFNQIATMANLPSRFMPEPLMPNKMFIFGAIAGATKGGVIHLVEVGDRNMLNLQRNYHFLFKICVLALAFFTAFKTTSFFSEQFDIPGAFTPTLLMVETVDLLHQIFFYFVNQPNSKAAHWSSRI